MTCAQNHIRLHDVMFDFFFQYITFSIKIKPTQITSDSNRPHPILSLYITRYNICFSEAMQFTMGRCFLFIFWLE